MATSLRRYKDLFPKTGLRVMIDSSSVVIGDVRIADDVSIWPLVAIRGDVNYVEIGARTNIQDGSVLHVTHKSSSNPHGNPLIIGDDVTVGHKVMLHGCTIGNRVLVGTLLADLLQPVGQLLRGIKVREALRQVDGTAVQTHARHTADDGVGKRADTIT